MKRIMQRSVLGALFIATSFTACSDSSVGLPLLTNQPVNDSTLGEFRVVVDAEQLTMTFEPIVAGSRTASRPNGLSLATYGTQGGDSRLFNSPVLVSTVGTRRRFTADVGMQNLKLFAIGDEESSSSAPPRDTMGVFIFQANPVMPCAPATCDVQFFNQHGTATFTAPDQKYFWYRDRPLAGAVVRANSGCPVGTAGFAGCQWVFDASSNTTKFSFFVQLRAAWEPGVDGDTRFTVVYEGDSLPELRAEPRWDVTSRSTVATNWSVTEGTALTVNQTGATINVTREYIRRDSVRSGDSAFVEATMRQTTTSTKGGTYIVGYLGLDDNTKFLAIGMNRTQVGFMTSAFAFIGTPVTAASGVNHSYRLVKSGTGVVQLFIDGSMTASQTLAYTSPLWSPSVTLPQNDYSFFFFGHRAGTNGSSSDAPGSSWSTIWDQVIYQVGR